MQFRCPHCGERGISAWRKSWLGYARTTTCSVCGGKVGLPKAAMWEIVPFLAAISVAVWVEPFWLKAALWIGGAAVMFLVHMVWVPLVKR